MGLIGACLAMALGACAEAESHRAGMQARSTTDPSSAAEAGLEGTLSDPGQVPTEVYRAMWTDLVTAARFSDYRSPLLARHATAQALALMTESVLDNWRQGAIMEGQPANAPVVLSLTPPTRPTRAVIDDCVDESSWLTDLPRSEGGSRVPGPEVHASATVLREPSGQWKVTELHLDDAPGLC